jgi:hypothetical protein
MIDQPDFQHFAGAMTLLRECVGCEAGQRVLIVHEPPGSGYYDDDAPRVTADAARLLGARVYQTQAAAFRVGSEDEQGLMDTLTGFDHIIFFSRVGDQIRFSTNDDLPAATMCYTLDLESLNSEFGTACYLGMCEVKQVIDLAFRNAEYLRVTCPLGTDYEGRPHWPAHHRADVSIKRFPMLVSCPVPTAGLRGNIALSRFLIGTGCHLYEPYVLPLKKTVLARIENERITCFDGSPEEVCLVEQHYRQVANQLSIDPWLAHSWHAGIHPGCYFPHAAEGDAVRWSGTAFGNPRVLHFHTCGNYAPGEISWNLLDTTIRIDDDNVWENGHLFIERIPGSEAVFNRHPDLLDLYHHPYTDVGWFA